jgi:hypothetical protein
MLCSMKADLQEHCKKKNVEYKRFKVCFCFILIYGVFGEENSPLLYVNL